MKIIQSFFQIDKKICFNSDDDNDNYLINFYSSLLSYITLKKLYGHVTIYCNSFAHENMLKFIPYDEVIIEELKHVNGVNYGNEWGLLKFHVFEQQKEPFIHIDSDVFLFNDLLTEYINSDDYDGIVQSIDVSDGVYGHFYRNNIDVLTKYNFVNKIPDDLTIKLNGSIGYNNGVIGFKNLSFMNYYIKVAEKLNDLMNSGLFKSINHQTMIFEQFNLYHLGIIKKMKFYKVLSDELIREFGLNEAGNKIGYTHLLSGNKFVDYFVMLVRNKVINDYPEFEENIKRFEETITNAKIKYLKHKNIENLVKTL